MEMSGEVVEFRTSKGVMIPLGTIVAVSLVLLVTVAMKGEKGFAVVVLCLLLPLALLFFSWFMRRLRLDEDGLLYRTLFRKRRVSWDQVKEMRIFTAGLRKVLYLDGGDKVLLIPLNIEDRDRFLKVMLQRLQGRGLPKESMEGLEKGGGFEAEPVFLWLAAIVLLGLLVLRLR